MPLQEDVHGSAATHGHRPLIHPSSWYLTMPTPHTYRIQHRQGVSQMSALFSWTDCGRVRADITYRHCYARTLLYSLPLRLRRPHSALLSDATGIQEQKALPLGSSSHSCSAVLVHELGMEGLEVSDDMFDLLLLRKASTSQRQHIDYAVCPCKAAQPRRLCSSVKGFGFYRGQNGSAKVEGALLLSKTTACKPHASLCQS